MGAERSGISRFINSIKEPIKKLFSHTNQPERKLNTRMVKTSSGIEVELFDDQPDEFAESMARAFSSGKITVGNFNEETGKFDVEEFDLPKTEDLD